MVELVAVLRMPGTTNEAATAPLLGQPAQAGYIFRKQTIGWAVTLPFYHTTSEAGEHAR